MSPVPMPSVARRGPHLGPLRILVLGLVSVSCGEAPSPPSPVEPVLATYAEVASQLYGQSLESARRMQAAVSDFVEAPDRDALGEARRAWIAARLDYGRTEALRFASGPIDGPGGPEALINAWPLDEAYIDGIPGAEESGFLQDPDRVPVIDEQTLTALNERGGEENVATGWHAIEFMLWGQDRSVDGPGDRDVRDFVDGPESPHAERRRTFLRVVTAMLIGHLEWLDEQWRDYAGTYRSELVATGGQDAMRRISSGLVEMVRGEIAGERLVVPYETRSQEDEQSCFSDTTTNDLTANVEGVSMVLRGGAEPLGPSLLDFLESRGVDVAPVSEALDAAMAAVADIPTPFDALLGPELADDSAGRRALMTAIERLEDLAMELEAAATEALGLLPTPPE